MYLNCIKGRLYFPFYIKAHSLYDGNTFLEEETECILLMMSWWFFYVSAAYILVCMCISVSQTDYASHIRMLQNTAGVPSYVYWLSSYSFDLILFTFFSVVLLLIISLYGFIFVNAFSDCKNLRKFSVILEKHVVIFKYFSCLVHNITSLWHLWNSFWLHLQLQQVFSRWNI